MCLICHNRLRRRLFPAWIRCALNAFCGGRVMEMGVDVTSGDGDIREIGDFATYGEALTVAIETLRSLETRQSANRVQYVEISDGDECRFKAEVSRSRW